MSLRTLHDSIRSQGDDDLAAVSLEEFFEGNYDRASIGCNLIEHPGPQTFYRILKALRDRPEVHTVLVAISEVMDEDEWPFSDRVFVAANAEAPQIERWIEGLQAEPVEEGWVGERPKSAPAEGVGYKTFTIWWD